VFDQTPSHCAIVQINLWQGDDKWRHSLMAIRSLSVHKEQNGGGKRENTAATAIRTNSFWLMAFSY
jgi:hypothetical protein